MSGGYKQVSVGNGDDKQAMAADGGQPAAPQTNFERLIVHLAKEGLGAKLVAAYAVPGQATPADAVARVATGRLLELKRRHDESKDQQD